MIHRVWVTKITEPNATLSAAFWTSINFNYNLIEPFLLFKS